MFTSRFIKGYSKSFNNLILQYNLEAQRLIKRERALAGHYTINGLEGNSVVFPRVLIFHKTLIMGPEIHQEWGYQKSLPRTVTTIII